MSSSSNQVNNNQIKNKQNKSTKGVKILKQGLHAEQRVQLIQLLAPPTSHFDDLRVKPVHELNKLSDMLLVQEALRLVTKDDPHGYTRTENVSIPQLLTIFATSAKSRDQSSLTKVMKAHEPSIKDIINGDSGDEICDDKDSDKYSDSSVEQLFPSVNNKMDGGAARAIKKPSFALIRPVSTLALATVGVQQPRLPYKRKHQPTKFYGQRIGCRGSHIIASSNTSLAENRLSLEQPQHGNELLCPTEILPINESFCAQTTNVDLVVNDLTDDVLNINNDVSNHDDLLKDVSAPNDISAYDSDVNIVFPNAIDKHAYDVSKSESFDDMENVDDGVAGSVIITYDSH